MKYLCLETFKDFECIGTECPLTCCGGGWGIIVDPDSYVYYKTVDGEFGEKLRNSITEEDGLNYFIPTSKGDCPFLNEKKLCDVYINLGEEHLCYTCTIYPRYYFSSGDIMFTGVSISCPVVARFLLSCQDTLQVDFLEDETELKIENPVDWDNFNQSIRVFTTSIEIAQNRNYSVRERLAILTLFLGQYQSYIDEKRNAAGLIELFSNESNYNNILPETGIYQKDLKAKVDFCIEVLRYYRGKKHMERKLPELADLARHFNSDSSMSAEKILFAFSSFDDDKEQIWQEQLLTYSLFRYFMQGFENDGFYNQYMIGLILVYWLYVVILVLYYHQWDKMPEFDDRVLMIAHISRLVEHDVKLKEDALEYFRSKGMTDPFFILKLIS